MRCRQGQKTLLSVVSGSCGWHEPCVPLPAHRMLAHAASAQGISAVENMCGDEHILNHDAIPAACFTHPEIAMVGPTEEQ